MIIHIYDASHPDMQAQYEHVQKTIKPMIEDRPVIDVANKCDLVESDNIPKDTIAVSATKLTGTIKIFVISRIEQCRYAKSLGHLQGSMCCA